MHIYVRVPSCRCDKRHVYNLWIWNISTRKIGSDIKFIRHPACYFRTRARICRVWRYVGKHSRNIQYFRNHLDIYITCPLLPNPSSRDVTWTIPRDSIISTATAQSNAILFIFGAPYGDNLERNEED